MRRLVYLAAAERDLLSILEHIARESGGAAIGLAFTERLQGQCARLASLPGALVPSSGPTSAAPPSATP